MGLPGSSERPIGFLDLPFELRHQIYCHCLVSKDPINMHHPSIHAQKISKSDICNRKKSLLLASKQVRSEALSVLYGENVFQKLLHGAGGYCPLKHFPEACRQGLRKIQIVLQPLGCFYGRRLDSTLWFPILAGLTRLSIVAQQPLQAQRYDTAPPLEQGVQRWVTWARTVLQYIVPQLSNSCIIEVDDDNRKEASALMRECLPTGYREVHTLEGDIYFKRINYVAESGC